MRTLPAEPRAEGSDVAIDVRTGSRPKLEPIDESAPPPEAARADASQRIRSLPPFDPTVARPSRNPLPRANKPTPKPILASECLRDDAAPIEPNARAARLWTAGLGLALLGCACVLVARAWPLTDASGTRAIATVAIGGAVVTALALAVRRYLVRGVLVLAAAVALVTALLVTREQGGFAVARWLAVVPLSAACFLRVSYRSDRAVRALLGASIVGFLGAACFVGGEAVFSGGVSLVARGYAGAMVVVGGLSLLGFMGEETTAGCTVWGALAAVLGAGSLAVDVFVRGGPQSLLAAAPAALALPLAAIGTFQIVATSVGPRMRVKTSSRSSLPAPPPEEHDPDEAMLPSDD